MAPNERLRGSIAAAGLDIEGTATLAEVDPKTVERWITKGRLPHRRFRLKVAGKLNVDETYLWPELIHDQKTQAASVAELLQLHPSRSAVPHELWRELITGARETMDVLVYSGTFLHEQHDIGAIVEDKTRHGTKFRFLIGDETSDAVRQRAIDEGTPGGLESRCQLMRRYLRDLLDLPGVQVRSHSTILYNSIFRFDEDLLVNGHAWGAPAGQSPVLHLRRVPGGRMFDHYMRSFDAVWASGVPELR